MSKKTHPIFEHCIGIDYSGAGTASDRLPGLQSYHCRPGQEAVLWVPDEAAGRRRARWSRETLTSALLKHLEHAGPTLVGIDHAVGFPLSYLTRYRLTHWDEFLADFICHWPTHRPGASVESLRDGNARSGTGNEYRLCDRWTAGAKSVFQFDVQGSVAKSTHAGLPWLALLRERLGPRLHIWPIDGFTPPAGVHVIAETFPSLFRRRYPAEARRPDEQDAYAAARWLSERCDRDEMNTFFHPPLDNEQRDLARREGWILGVM